MDLLLAAWEFIGNLDNELALLLMNYGGWIYGILFLIIFCETGLVIVPFLPGDSLLFASGALWATAGMPVELLVLTLITASFCGDNCNYWIGRLFGSRVVKKAHTRFLNQRALERTHQFYARHGGKTIILARFVPIVRTFAPFVAGIGHMDYHRFLLFSVVGALLWVGLLVSCGYLFGKLPMVQDNFALVIVAIIVFSLVPVGIEYMRARLRR
ncbi:MAG TPA: DedA family protein [Casimicrobiaceae bacterium]|jgi:membrane-associated protein|nr:DedA family protein [Casimicrobiaceae bacterium]